MRKSVIVSYRRISFGWSEEGGRDGRGTWHAWRRRKIDKILWRINLKETDYLEEQGVSGKIILRNVIRIIMIKACQRYERRLLQQLFFLNVTFVQLKFSPRIKYQSCTHALNPHACYWRKRHLPFLMIWHRSYGHNLHLSTIRFIYLFFGLGQPRRTMHRSLNTPL